MRHWSLIRIECCPKRSALKAPNGCLAARADRQDACLIQKAQFSQCDILDISRQFSAPTTGQINSVSESAKPRIMINYNSSLYSLSILIYRWLAKLCFGS
jgi:hypothetical protein